MVWCDFEVITVIRCLLVFMIKELFPDFFEFHLLVVIRDIRVAF
jgi:hypothetical protein